VIANARRAGVVPAAAMAVGGLVVFAVLVRAYFAYTVDDTYIFLRYAKHLATGAGLTWNPGEPPAEGYTSFSWTVLLAVPHLLHVDAVIAAKGMSVACMVGAAAAAAKLAWRLGVGVDDARRWLAPGAAAFLVSTSTATAVHAVSGMETAFATLLVTLFALATERVVRGADGDRRAPWWMAASGFALGLTRPEGNLLVVVVTVGALVRLPRAARGPVVRAFGFGYALPGALYFAWRLARYRHLLPLPFYVKAIAPSVDGAAFAGTPECLELLRLLTIAQPWIGVPLVVGVGGGWRRTAVLPLLAGIAVWWLFFLFPRHEMGYDLRYLYPLVPSLMALAGAGAARLAARVASRVPTVAWPACLAILVATTAYRHLDGSLAEKRDYGAGVLRAHAALGRALAASHPPGRAVVAALDCGAMAYYADGWSVIDTWGLNDPEIALAAAHGGRSAERILARDPTVIVVISQRRDTFVPHFEYEGPLYAQALARGYRHDATFEFLPDYQLWVLARPPLVIAPDHRSGPPPW
jgi:hypothetical protein